MNGRANLKCSLNHWKKPQLLIENWFILLKLIYLIICFSKKEAERDKFFTEKKEMQENLDKYKRRFVAELNRDLGSMCVQMGNGVNRALMEVMVRLSESNVQRINKLI